MLSNNTSSLKHVDEQSQLLQITPCFSCSRKKIGHSANFTSLPQGGHTKSIFFFPRCYSKKAQRTVLGHSPSCDFTINCFWLQLPPPLCHMVLANMEEETTSFRQVSGKSWLRRLERRENAKGRKNRCRSFSSKVNK